MFLRPHFRRRNSQREALLGSGRGVSHRAWSTAMDGGLSGTDGRRRPVGCGADVRSAAGFAAIRTLPGGPDRAAVRRDRPHASAGRELPAVRRPLAGLGADQAARAARMRTLPTGQTHVPWSFTALILVIARLLRAAGRISSGCCRFVPRI
jgi:hypothetical protein